MICTIKNETREEKLRLMDLMNQTHEKLKDHVGEVLVLTDFIITERTGIDPETGEKNEYDRLILICLDGSTYEIASPTAIDYIKQLGEILDNKTFMPPVSLEVIQHKSNKGRFFYSFKNAE